MATMSNSYLPILSLALVGVACRPDSPPKRLAPIQIAELTWLDAREARIAATASGPFHGFGTSLAWFGNVIGRFDHPVRERLADLLFDPQVGLGLNIVRYNIGGGDHPRHDHMRPGGAVPGFRVSPSAPYDWDADPGQRWLLHAALRRGVRHAEAFANSPPWWLTHSGCSAGALDPGDDNLRADAYDAFADYLTEVVRHFRDAWGVTFTTLAPLNEPGTRYWQAGGRQEGAHFEPASQARILTVVALALERKGLFATRLSANDETNLDLGVRELAALPESTRRQVAQINLHAYGGSARRDARSLARRHGMGLWMSEWDGGGGVPYDPSHMAPALELANAILTDLRELQPDAWVLWQAVENAENMTAGHENSNWGLIHADFAGGTQGFRLTKKYFAMAQFSRFLRPGSHLVVPDWPGAILAIGPSAREWSWVLVNTAREPEALSLPQPAWAAAARVKVVETSGRGDLIELPAPVPRLGGPLSLRLSPESITSVVFSLP